MPLLVSAVEMPPRELASSPAPEAHLSAPSSIETLSLLLIVIPTVLVVSALCYVLFKLGNASSSSPSVREQNGHMVYDQQQQHEVEAIDDDEEALLLTSDDTSASPPQEQEQPWRATSRVSSTARGTVPSSPPQRATRHATSLSLSSFSSSSAPAATIPPAKQVVGSKAARAEALARDKWRHQISVSVDMDAWEREEMQRGWRGGAMPTRKAD